MKKFMICGFLLFCSVIWAESAKYICKVSHLGPNAVAIVCLNGADPTGRKAGDVLIISCASEAK